VRVGRDDLRAEHVSQEVQGVDVCVRAVSVPRQPSAHAQIYGAADLREVSSGSIHSMWKTSCTRTPAIGNLPS